MTDTEPRCPRCGNILRTATHDDLKQAWCEHCQAPNRDLFPPEEPSATDLPALEFDTPPSSSSSSSSSPPVDQPAPKLDIETWFEAAPPPWEKPAPTPAPEPIPEHTLAHPPTETHTSLPVATPLTPSAHTLSEPELLIVTPPAPISEELEIIETPVVPDVHKAKLLEAKLIEPKKADPAKPDHLPAKSEHSDSIPVVRPKPRLSLSHLPEAKPLAERTPTVFRPPHELPDPERPKPRVFMAMVVILFTTLAFIIGIAVIAFAILYGFRKVSRPKAANPGRVMVQPAEPKAAPPLERP